MTVRGFAHRIRRAGLALGAALAFLLLLEGPETHAEWTPREATAAPTSLQGQAPPTATPSTAAPTPAMATLGADIDAILSQGRYRTAEWGVLVVSMDRGDTLYARGAHEPLVPASTLKVVTGAAALHFLGPDYRYPTWVLTRGSLRDSTLVGDVVLYGTGDPGMAQRFHETRDLPLQELADQLLALGIRRIEGRVLGDGTFFRGPLLAPGWNERDLNEWFTAPSGALSFNENVIAVRIRAGTPGDRPVVETTPPHSGLFFLNEATTVPGPERRPLWLLRDDPSEPVRVVGEMNVAARDIWRQMTVRYPDLLAAHAFTDVLGAAGIQVSGPPGTVAEEGRSPLSARRVHRPDDDLRVLARFDSPPLSDYLRAVNQRSHNLYADLFLKTLGRVVDGDGSFEGGARVVTRYLENVVGVPDGEATVVDGSGLSDLNRVSPAALVRIIDDLQTGPHWDIWQETLPVAGSRELFRRMARTSAAGNLRAKTGTKDRVSSLTGVVSAADGERLLFAIIGNELPSEMGAKRLEDRFGRTLAEWRR